MNFMPWGHSVQPNGQAHGVLSGYRAADMRPLLMQRMAPLEGPTWALGAHCVTLAGPQLSLGLALAHVRERCRET